MFLCRVPWLYIVYMLLWRVPNIFFLHLWLLALSRISQQNLFSKGIFSTKCGDLPKTSVHNQPLPTRFVNCLVAYVVVDPPKKIMKNPKGIWQINGDLLWNARTWPLKKGSSSPTFGDQKRSRLQSPGKPANIGAVSLSSPLSRQKPPVLVRFFWGSSLPRNFYVVRDV